MTLRGVGRAGLTQSGSEKKVTVTRGGKKVKVGIDEPVPVATSSSSANGCSDRAQGAAP
ncbi:MAG: hypothetical protein KIS90_00100 [Phenylobacterium sp.]|nr:hypothetical protein [Phenylobacterium sp.]